MSEIRTWVLGYLLNSAWQVPLLFCAGWVLARMARPTGAEAEHRVWVGVLLGQAVLPACSMEPWRWLSGFGVWRHMHGEQGRVTVVMGPLSLLNGPSARNGVFTAMVLMYGAVVLYFAARLAWRSWRLRALRRSSHAVELAGEAERCWMRCCERFGVKGAVLATSGEIAGPVTMGLRRRLVLLPADMMHALREEDLQTVIAHECAHMRRRDFAKNLLYEVVRVPVMYHPFAWWTRLRVTESREVICDAMAAEAAAGRERYARSLLRLASLRVTGQVAQVSNAIGIFDANEFERRVMRLIEGQRRMSGVQRAAMLAACVTAGLGTCASALAMRMEVAGVGAPVTGMGALPEAGAPAADAKGPVKVSSAVMAAQTQTKEPPVYPVEAKQKKIQGAVVLHAVIGKDGTVENLQVMSGPEVLRRSALDAVKSWTYKPYLLNGDPEEVETTITVNYSLAP